LILTTGAQYVEEIVNMFETCCYQWGPASSVPAINGYMPRAGHCRLIAGNEPAAAAAAMAASVAVPRPR